MLPVIITVTANKAYFCSAQVSDFPDEQLLVAVFPGVPTAAELFLLPHKNQSAGKKKSEEELEQVWATVFGIISQIVEILSNKWLYFFKKC